MRRRAFKQPPATARKQRVTAEQQWRAIHVGGEVGNVARRVPGHIQHAKVQPQGLHLIAAVQRAVGLGNALARRAINLRARGRAQLRHAAGVIGVVVRD